MHCSIYYRKNVGIIIMKQKMMTILQKMYCVYVVITIFIILFIVGTFRLDSFEVEDSHFATEYSEWEVYDEQGIRIGTYYDDIKTERNQKLYLKTVLPDELDYDTALGFYTIHTAVRVYVGDVLIYQKVPDANNLFGHTAGYLVNMIPKLYQYRGEEIVIELTPPYQGYSLPTTFLGSTSGILIEEIKGCAVPLLTGLVTLTTGMLISACWLVFRKQISRFFLYLGVFSVNVAIYNLNDQVLVQLLFQDSVAPAYVSFVSLMLLPLSFVMFIRELYHDKYDKIWLILLGANYFNITTTFLLQLFNVADFKNTLIIEHSMLVVLFFTIFPYTVREIMRYKVSKTMKMNVSLVVFLTLSLVLDLIRYYASGGVKKAYCANIAFLIYIIIIAINEIKESKKIAEKAQTATLYERMAYTDKITGLGNRMAHEKVMDMADVDKHNYIVAMFDLNNLKRCNDSLGHTAGDEYIQKSAEILKECFDEVAEGNIFRIGGDEFCVLMKNIAMETYESCIQRMLRKVELYNAASKKINMQIAYGCAFYDESMDGSLKETRSRADSVMYEKKFFMKKENQKK